MHEQIYRKVGRRYKVVGVCQEPTWYPPGCSLVVVDNGCTSIQYKGVTPDAAPLLAALRLCRDKLASMVVETSRARHGTPASADELRAWEIIKREIPTGLPMMQFPSAIEIVEALESELVRIVNEPADTPQL